MVRFQCGHCGRHYAVSEEMRGRAFKLKCQACGQMVVVRPPPVPEVNPFAAEPVTAAGASGRKAGGATDAPAAPPGDEPPALPAAGREGDAAAPVRQKPPGGPASVADAPAIAGPTAEELSVHPDWFGEVEAAGLASDGLSPSSPAPEGPAGGRESPAIEELRRALAEALEDPSPGTAPADGRAAPLGAPDVPPPPHAAPPPAGPPPGPAGTTAGEAPGRESFAVPAAPPVLFRSAARRSPGSTAALALAAVAVLAVVAGVLSRRQPRPATQASGAAATSVPPAGAGMTASGASPATTGVSPTPSGASPTAAAAVLAPAAPAVLADVPPRIAPLAAPVPTVAPRPASSPKPATTIGPASPRPTALATPAGSRMPATLARPAASVVPAALARPASTVALVARPAPAPVARPEGKPPTSEDLARALVANPEPFDACLAASPSREGPDPVLLATVTPAGEVTFPTLDDVALARSDLGACVKAAARKLTFPPFAGEPVRVEAPLRPPARR